MIGLREILIIGMVLLYVRRAGTEELL